MREDLDKNGLLYFWNKIKTKIPSMAPVQSVNGETGNPWGLIFKGSAYAPTAYTDFNSITDPGIYYMNRPVAEISNGPSFNFAYSYLYVTNRGDYIIQEIVKPSLDARWMREYSGSPAVWSTWRLAGNATTSLWSATFTILTGRRLHGLLLIDQSAIYLLWSAGAGTTQLNTTLVFGTAPAGFSASWNHATQTATFSTSSSHGWTYVGF